MNIFARFHWFSNNTRQKEPSTIGAVGITGTLYPNSRIKVVNAYNKLRKVLASNATTRIHSPTPQTRHVNRTAKARMSKIDCNRKRFSNFNDDSFRADEPEICPSYIMISTPIRGTSARTAFQRSVSQWSKGWLLFWRVMWIDKTEI